jgi:hypothetical protein
MLMHKTRDKSSLKYKKYVFLGLEITIVDGLNVQ